MQNETSIHRILELARWAPSGDNAQPWRFKIINEHTLEIHYRVHSDNVYERYHGGEPVHLGVGCLLETIRIAAARESLACAWQHREAGGGTHSIEVQLTKANVLPDTLLAFIPHRSVNRLSYQKKPLQMAARKALENALGEDFAIQWHEGAMRCKIAKLNALATHIRLSIPEAYPIHRDILEWNKPFSEDKIPVLTLPISPLSRAMMRFALKSWKRVEFMNRYIAGTKGPQLEMDILPGLNCAAHFFITKKTASQSSVADTLKAGERLQRFWLTATSLGLVMHPSLATLVFAGYGKQGERFTNSSKILADAQTLSRAVEEITATPLEQLVFAGRIGYPKSPEIKSRSVRKPLEALAGTTL